MIQLRMLRNPITASDLRMRLRGWRWAGVTTFYVGVLAVVALTFLLQQYDTTSGGSTQVGADLLQALALCQLFLIAIVTPISMGGAISSERLRGTWDLLLVTRLSPFRILWGKLLAGLAFNLLLLAASLPLFLLTFLFGGVGIGDLARTYFVLLVTVLFLGAIAVTISALTSKLAVSYSLSLFAALVVTVGLSLLALDLEVQGKPSIASLGTTAFQSVNAPSPLTPFAQLDPLVALLSALPGDSGGTLLGGLGTVQHAFLLPWQLPLWGAYAVLSFLLSALMFALASRSLRSRSPWQRTGGRI